MSEFLLLCQHCKDVCPKKFPAGKPDYPITAKDLELEKSSKDSQAKVYSQCKGWAASRRFLPNKKRKSERSSTVRHPGFAWLDLCHCPLFNPIYLAVWCRTWSSTTKLSDARSVGQWKEMVLQESSIRGVFQLWQENFQLPVVASANKDQ